MVELSFLESGPVAKVDWPGKLRADVERQAVLEVSSLHIDVCRDRCATPAAVELQHGSSGEYANPGNPFVPRRLLPTGGGACGRGLISLGIHLQFRIRSAQLYRQETG